LPLDMETWRAMTLLGREARDEPPLLRRAFHKQRAQPLPSGLRWNPSSTVRYVQRWTACDPPHASAVGWRYGCFGMRSVAKSADGAEMTGRCALSLLT
jgi:hypothetical protein